MDRIIPIAILVFFAIIGYVIKRIELSSLIRRRNFTIEYGNKFITLVNDFVEHGRINNDLYIELTEKIVEMQTELGDDGVYAMIDRLTGISNRNYQALINFLPEIRTLGFGRDNSIMMERFMKSAQTCEDTFFRHKGQLDKKVKDNEKHLYNPFSCLADGIRWILWLPANILYWCGFISAKLNYKLRVNLFFKFIAFLITIIGLIGSVITIIIGWDQFFQIIAGWFTK